MSAAARLVDLTGKVVLVTGAAGGQGRAHQSRPGALPRA